MPKVLKKALSLLTSDGNTASSLSVPKISVRPFRKLTERELIQLESDIGSKLFGPIPEGHRRAFFNLDEDTWIWHEEYKDKNGSATSQTTRYEIKDDAVLKAQDGAPYTYIDDEELQNFTLAVQMYYEQVARGIYKRDPQTGQKLAD